uniref:Protein kinase domain-containing protein n=1 Tax=Amphimedon queenslandica TaxID=400682 RepID=A0A1X7VGG6_AMPQE
MLYKCCVYIDGKKAGSAHFDVTYQPSIDMQYDHDNDSLPPPLPPPIQSASSSAPNMEILSIPAPKVDSIESTMEEIVTATNHLDNSNELGKGGYGNVYLANNLRSIGTKAAVKILTKEG